MSSTEAILVLLLPLGTGLQEVTSIISNRGGGISQAIGTGGRDVKAEIGGIMFLEALARSQRRPGNKSHHPGIQTTTPNSITEDCR